MATSPTDPTMQIPSPELIKRIESLVSSLLGVTESHVERDEAGAIRSLHASVAPGHSPDRVRREIRSALLSSLDLELAAEVVEVDVEEQLGSRQERFWRAPAERGAAGPASPAGEGPDGEGTGEAEGSREEESVPEPAEPSDFGDARERAEAQEVEEAPQDEATGGTGGIGARVESAESTAGAGPEGWLSRADAPPRPRGRGRAGERWPAEDRRTREDRRSEEERRSEEDRRSPEDRRTREDRRSTEDRRDWEDRRAGEDRRSGTDRRAGEREAAPAPEEEEARAPEPEIPSAAYIDAIIDRLRQREGAQASTRSGAVPSTGAETADTEDAPESIPRPEAAAPREGAARHEAASPSEGPAPREEAAPHGSPEPTGGLLPLALGEYVLFGGGGDDRGVELRIRVKAGGDPFVGTVQVRSLEDVSPGLFVGATLRAVERALDARPVSERSARILILEAVDMEEVVLREGRFLTATVQAVHRDGESRATGLVPAEGRIIREAAAEAALDAVTRILEGRHTRRVEGRGRIRREPGDVSGGGEGRGPIRGSREGGRSGEESSSREAAGYGGGEERASEGRGSRGRMERDPFNIWE